MLTKIKKKRKFSLENKKRRNQYGREYKTISLQMKKRGNRDMVLQKDFENAIDRTWGSLK